MFNRTRKMKRLIKASVNDAIVAVMLEDEEGYDNVEAFGSTNIYFETSCPGRNFYERIPCWACGELVCEKRTNGNYNVYYSNVSLIKKSEVQNERQLRAIRIYPDSDVHIFVMEKGNPTAPPVEIIKHTQEKLREGTRNIFVVD